MGLFNFTKQNKTLIPEVKAPESTPAPVTPPVAKPEVYPVTKPEAVKNKVPDPVAAKENKDDISSFFSINIYNIFKHKPESEGRQEYEKGKWAEIFTLNLHHKELETFHKVHIVLYENGIYDLVFRSNLCEFKSEMEEFLSFCVKKFGEDFAGKKELTDIDCNDLRLGAFSRFWINRIRIDNVYLPVNMTFYNIKPETK